MDLIGQYLAPVIPLIIALFALIIVLGVMSSKQEKEQKRKSVKFAMAYMEASSFQRPSSRRTGLSGAVGASRVHAHFNGKGNGDVYADVRNGKHVYVQLKPCPKDQMNDL